MVRTYTVPGVEHILGGVDHMLFVLGLLLIVQNRWMLMEMITAFTGGQTDTLEGVGALYPTASLKWNQDHHNFMAYTMAGVPGGDSGAGAVLGDFKSRVSGIGPQIGYFVPVGGKKWYVNRLK